MWRLKEEKCDEQLIFNEHLHIGLVDGRDERYRSIGQVVADRLGIRERFCNGFQLRRGLSLGVYLWEELLKLHVMQYNITVVQGEALFCSCLRSCLHTAWSMVVSFSATWGVDGSSLPFDDTRYDALSCFGISLWKSNPLKRSLQHRYHNPKSMSMTASNEIVKDVMILITVMLKYAEEETVHDLTIVLDEALFRSSFPFSCSSLNKNIADNSIKLFSSLNVLYIVFMHHSMR